MKYAKPQRTKKRRHHKESILHAKNGTCYLCMKLNHDYSKKVVQEHHVFGGVANRPISEAEGFKAYLCLPHHVDGAAAVHNNQKNMRLLQQDAQQAYEKTHTRQQFMKLIGKNYLESL